MLYRFEKLLKKIIHANCGICRISFRVFFIVLFVPYRNERDTILYWNRTVMMETRKSSILLTMQFIPTFCCSCSLSLSVSLLSLRSILEFRGECACALIRYTDGLGRGAREKKSSGTPPWWLDSFSSLAETRTNESVVTVSGMGPG